MKRILPFFALAILVLSSCTSQKKLAYLNNLPEPTSEETFSTYIPDYKIQPRDILYITAKAMTPEGMIADFLSSGSSGTNLQGESGGYFFGYVVDKDGNIIIPTVGIIKVGGLTLDEIRSIVQTSIDKVFKNTVVDCKLQSFKITVIGEVINPGTFVNYTNYLTVFEALGRAGGLGDNGNRRNILVIRPIDKGTRTFTINLQDKQILSSDTYYLLPNDVLIVQPLNQKIFSMNIPTISFILSLMSTAISTTLLLILYSK